MVTANTSLMAGDGETAYANALKAVQLATQNPEVALGLALSAAIWSRDSDHAAQIATQMASAAPTGPYFQAWRIHASAAVSALEGRTAEAIGGFRDSRARLIAMQQHFEAATWVVEAAILLPGEAEVRAWASEVRPLLEELRAKPFLDKLDEVLTSAQTPSAGAKAESRAESPAG